MLLDLEQFTGTEQWWHLGPPYPNELVYTDGIRYLAQTASCYWLIQEVFNTNLFNKAVRAEEFQVWKLHVENSEGWLVCDDGNDNVVYRKHIPYTDFPVPEIKLYFTNNVLLLPSEY